MEWVIAAAVGVIGTLVVSLVYFFVVGPSAHAAGIAEDVALQKAKAEGLQAGAAAVEKVTLGQMTKIAEHVVEQKQRSAVDVANEEIQRRLKTLGKKP